MPGNQPIAVVAGSDAERLLRAEQETFVDSQWDFRNWPTYDIAFTGTIGSGREVNQMSAVHSEASRIARDLASGFQRVRQKNTPR